MHECNIATSTSESNKDEKETDVRICLKIWGKQATTLEKGELLINILDSMWRMKGIGLYLRRGKFTLKVTSYTNWDLDTSLKKAALGAGVRPGNLQGVPQKLDFDAPR